MIKTALSLKTCNSLKVKLSTFLEHTQFDVSSKGIPHFRTFDTNT